MDATLVTAWTALCQLVTPAFTQPTSVTFVHIATGWVLCRSKPTVTNLVGTIGQSLLGHVAKHWTVYERFFYRTVWSLDAVSRLLLTGVVAPLIRAEAVDKVIDLNIDDTTCGRCGKHVAYAGYFKDASVGNTLKTVVHWSHNWVIGCVSMRAKRWPTLVIGLPVWFTLYRKRPNCNRKHPFMTRQEIAAAMIRDTRKALPDWTIRVAADGQYATGAVVKAAAQTGTNLVSRIRSDAAIYNLPPKRKRFKRGRRAKRGKRLPTPKRLARRQKGWRTVEALIYKKRVKRRVLSVTCLWYHVSRDHPVKVLIVRDPSGRQTDDYMVCTDATVSEAEIIERFAARWSIEEAIQQGKQVGGMEQVQGWCPRTVVRQAPMAMIVQTLVTTWYLRYGVQARWAQPRGSDWTPSKDHPSYLDMVATLRKALWTDRIKCNSTLSGRVRELWKTLQFTLCAAA
jgi:DDE superfamily endonuclease